MRAVLQEAGCFRVVGEAGNGLEALELALKFRPSVALVDIKMPVMNGLEVTREMRRRCPEVPVLIVTSVLGDETVRAALNAGAAGYLLKDATPEELVASIFRVIQGRVELSPSVARRLALGFGTRPVLDNLTPRETEVLSVIAAGHSNDEIAARLSISVKTVKVHVSSLLAKLACDSRLKLAVYAWRNRLVSLDDPEHFAQGA